MELTDRFLLPPFTGGSCEKQRQEEVYKHVIASDDYQLLERNTDLCECGSGEMRKECHYKHIPSNHIKMFDVKHLDVKHPGMIPWSRILLPAMTGLIKLCNHLELIKVVHISLPRPPQ